MLRKYVEKLIEKNGIERQCIIAMEGGEQYDQ